MKIGLAILSSFAATCGANYAVDLSVDIPADSKMGNSILSKARRVEEGEEEDFTWVADYSIKFKSCHSVDNFGEGGAEEGESPVGVQHLATFQLCPSDTSCKSCSKGGDYVLQLRDFVESYTEIKQEISEAACAVVEANCNCEYYYGDDESCLTACYADAGLDDCVEDEDEFEVEKYMECEQAEFSNDAYYSQTYYIGPICAKGGSALYLDVFKDASCTIAADSGTYETFVGTSLPYSKDSKVSIVNNDCISCEAAAENEDEDEDEDGDDQNNYYNKYYYKEASESCTKMYEESGKCEKKMKGMSSIDNTACNYINKRLPALERVYSRGGGSSITTFFMWAFIITTLGASAAAYYFYTIGDRNNVNLSGNGGSRNNGRIL